MGIRNRVLAALALLLVVMGLSACRRQADRSEYGPDFVERMTQHLQDESDRTRMGAAHALGRMGAQAKRSIPALVCALDDPNPGVRTEAMRALGKIDPTARPDPSEHPANRQSLAVGDK
jgi:HEAT repeat protein